jgi:hypothetical protein
MKAKIAFVIILLGFLCVIGGLVYAVAKSKFVSEVVISH